MSVIGIDVGGTFTDVVLIRGAVATRVKVPSTPDDLGVGVMHGCEEVARRAGTDLLTLMPEVTRFGLGTTQITNVIASRTGPRVGLLTTAGFEETLYFAHSHREPDGDLGWVRPPEPLVDRECVVGVKERVDRLGRVVEAIALEEAISAARELVENRGVEALAICFLWSFANPVHEESLLEALGSALPDIPVMASSRLLPVAREYERMVLSTLNAYTSGAMSGIAKLAVELRSSGLRVPMLLVHSGGGATTVAAASQAPATLAESGPAAGVAAASKVAMQASQPNVIACDLGGTSFDISLVSGGRPQRRNRGYLMGLWTAMSMVDIESIGAGGGSIGWADARGMIRVGPRSAGSYPGPACYGRGGIEPTVTDALVVLGYIDPEHFLGGEMVLDGAAAYDACERLGKALGVCPEDAAWGIRELALTEMSRAVRRLLSSRGLDPKDLSIVSYGGCGALFTADIAHEVGVRQLLIPELASVLSAFGAATADTRRERSKAVDVRLLDDNETLSSVASSLGSIASSLAVEVDADLAADGVDSSDRSVIFEVDVRFERQSSELAILVRGDLGQAETIQRVGEDFKAEYIRRFGQGALMMGATVVAVTLRGIGLGNASTNTELRQRDAAGSGTETVMAERSVMLERGGGRTAVPVFSEAVFVPGHTVQGPSLIDCADTTIWIPAGFEARIDDGRTLRMEALT